MHPSQIRKGGFYVNKDNWLVREVIAATLDGSVYYRDYYLEDGRPSRVTPQQCLTTTLANWAGREATADEVARLDTQHADALAEEQMQMDSSAALWRASDERLFAVARHRNVLQSFSDDELLAEVQRRGLR